MLRYKISYSNPSAQFIDITFSVSNVQDQTTVCLPVWRPGRYELGNFAKNIQQFNCFDENGNPLVFEKIEKSQWLIQTKGVKTLTIKYNYYAAELNAGSTFLNEEQLYVNPINCCLYIKDRQNEPCELEIIVPETYQFATSLKKTISKNKFTCADFHELVDSPFIASPSLKHNLFILDGVEFHIWFQGICKPDWSIIINDFFIFVNENFETMKSKTTDEYHFIFQLLPYHHYHGVEHLKSTVIALGPGYDLHKEKFYNNLLGISCHELFHSWNIKSIRPIEMMPYDYSKENYSKLGYVCEGVTTYYGDFLLYRGGVYNDADYFYTFNEQLNKHFNNTGRLNMSVGASSFDTWLDGYVPGIPNKKVSIYTEGCLCAFMLDILIRRNTQNAKSLDDVMRILYSDYALNGKGYSEQDYKAVAENVSGLDLTTFFNDYYNGVKDYTILLTECMAYVGLQMTSKPSELLAEAYLGFKYLDDKNNCVVKVVYPNAIAEKAGLSVGDNILAINGIKLENNLQQWLNFFTGTKELQLTVAGIMLQQKAINLAVDNTNVYYKQYSISKNANVDEAVKANFKAWCKKVF